MSVVIKGAVLMFLLAAVPTLADEGWTVQLSGPVTIRTRPLQGTGIREVWAEAELDAPVQDLQATLLDARSFPKFMPYVTDIQELTPSGAVQYVYTRVDPPFIGARDYILAVHVDASVAADGSGKFVSHWLAVPDWLPERRGCVRLRKNEGGWQVTARSGGGSHVVYRLVVDPGGIPSFLVNLGSKSGVVETLRAVEKEAQRRAALREQASSTASRAGRMSRSG